MRARGDGWWPSSAAVSAPSSTSASSRLAVRARFAADLGLVDPGISWLSSRDRIAEFGSVLTMVTGTLARIGGEVYELQRPEIGELGEPRPAGAVGSITMHHKRNPEGSEHLDTLARLTRASCGVLMESLVSAHERDGRAWKAEWVALPEVCLLTGAALSIAATSWTAWRSTWSGWPPTSTPTRQRAGARCSPTARRQPQRARDYARRRPAPGGPWPTRCRRHGRRPDRGRRADARRRFGQMVDLVVARAAGGIAVNSLALLPTPLLEMPRLADALGLGGRCSSSATT